MKTKSGCATKNYSQQVCAALVLSLGFAATAVQAETSLTGSLTLTSDYLFRGISQTDEGMALQGGLTLADDSGFYLATWGSNITFGQGSMELDLLAGWTGKLSEEWTTDVGIMQYRYPNGDNDTDQFNFVEIYINTSVEECERRDVKGLYRKARAGEIKNMTGISAPYEAPSNPDLEIKTEDETIEASVKRILEVITPKLQLKDE